MRDNVTITGRRTSVLRRAPMGRAFTAVELLMALCLAGVIALCVVSLLGASGQIWGQQQQGSSDTISGSRAQSYIERELREAHDVGYWWAGTADEPAVLLLWAHDLHTEVADARPDHRVQRSELLLIRHDPDAKQLTLLRPRPWSEMSASEQTEAAEIISSADLALKQTAEDLAASDWVETHVLSGGAGESVTGCWWNVDRSNDRPIVKFRLEIVRGGKPVTLSGIVSMRVRAAEDDWSRSTLEAGDADSSDGDPSGSTGPSGQPTALEPALMIYP